MQHVARINHVVQEHPGVQVWRLVLWGRIDKAPRGHYSEGAQVFLNRALIASSCHTGDELVSR